MAIPGTIPLAGQIAPTDTVDTYPTHDAIYGRGGLTHAATTVARDAIPAARRRAGMFCYVEADEKTYQLGLDLVTWTVFSSGGAVVGGTQALTLASTDYVLDTLDITLFRTTRWALEFKKGTNLLILEIVASHDGSSASEVRPTSMLIGTTADVAAVVDISSGNLRLYVSASSTGWTATWQRLYAMGA